MNCPACGKLNADGLFILCVLRDEVAVWIGFKNHTSERFRHAPAQPAAPPQLKRQRALFGR